MAKSLMISRLQTYRPLPDGYPIAVDGAVKQKDDVALLCGGGGGLAVKQGEGFQFPDEKACKRLQLLGMADDASVPCHGIRSTAHFARKRYQVHFRKGRAFMGSLLKSQIQGFLHG